MTKNQEYETEIMQGNYSENQSIYRVSQVEKDILQKEKKITTLF